MILKAIKDINQKRVCSILGVLICVCISMDINAQCMILNVPLNNRIDQSDVIVEGRVINSNAYWNGGKDMIYTSNIVEVNKLFKGDLATENIEIITQGGIVGDTWIKVEPGLDLNVGDVGIFLCNTDKGNSAITSLTPNALSLGFIRYDINESGASDLFNRYSDIKTNLYDRIVQNTGVAFLDLHKFDLASDSKSESALKIALAPVITSFLPSIISAGSKSVLTINGSGFGATRGTNTVGFYNSNDGGATWSDMNDNSTTADDLYYLLWSDTKIQVYVPQRTTSPAYYAGTGKVSVTVGGVRAVSASSLYIKWCRYDAQSVDGPVSSVLANINGAGGYTWQMSTTFAANAAAAAAFQRAMNTWSCNTKVNWKVGANTTITSKANDGVNVIRFANAGELPNNILGTTTTSYRLFCGTGAARRWYQTEFDMQMNSALILDQYGWQYGPALAKTNQIDFETVVVHELGHAMQLGHIIKPGFMMNFQIGIGENTRTPHAEVLEGGNAITASSFLTPSCNGPSPDGGAMIPYTPASCAAAGIYDDFKFTGIDVFPVPAAGSINISIRDVSAESLQYVSILDQLGKEVLYKNLNNSTTPSTSINIENIGQGIYFIKAGTDSKVFTGKIIVAR